jgi:hypothetical protein
VNAHIVGNGVALSLATTGFQPALELICVTAAMCWWMTRSMTGDTTFAVVLV